MRIAVNKMSALHLLRSTRSAHGRFPSGTSELADPDPSPRRRWTRSALPERIQELPRPLHVAVPSSKTRIQASFARSTVYSRGLPAGAFADLGDGILASTPELLFVELASIMRPMVLALVGYELCGTFSRDAANPRTGPITYGVAPATSVEKIRAFAKSSRLQYTREALEVLDYVHNNAWSPMEAIVAALATMPGEFYGYDLGDIALNVRHANPSELTALGCPATRVPDIEILGTHVGLNYDGREHLDLDSIANAQGAEAANAAAAARAKYVDDLRRNRELAAQGRVILPVTAEDLFEEGAMDTLMLELAMAAELFGGASTRRTRNVIAARAVTSARQQLIWSLLPWDAAGYYGRLLRDREIAATSHSYVVDLDIEV